MDGNDRSTFRGATVGGSIALSLLVGVSGGYQSPLAWLGWLTMFLPALGVLAVRLRSGAPVDGRGQQIDPDWLYPPDSGKWVFHFSLETVGETMQSQMIEPQPLGQSWVMEIGFD